MLSRGRSRKFSTVVGRSLLFFTYSKAALVCRRTTLPLFGSLGTGRDMPEFMGKKITRAEESARHAYRRSLEKSVRMQARDTGWKSAGGSIFREQALWFIEASPSVYIYEHVTKAVISVKPMAIDPIFWGIVGMPENQQQPLSFRANGAWTCCPPIFAELQIEEHDDHTVVADRLIAAATGQLEIVLKSYTLDAFRLTCLDGAGAKGSYLPCVVTTLIALGREDEALAACKDASTQGLDGGFLAPEGSFVKMAVAYL